MTEQLKHSQENIWLFPAMASVHRQMGCTERLCEEQGFVLLLFLFFSIQRGSESQCEWERRESGWRQIWKEIRGRREEVKQRGHFFLYKSSSSTLLRGFPEHNLKTSGHQRIPFLVPSQLSFSTFELFCSWCSLGAWVCVRLENFTTSHWSYQLPFDRFLKLLKHSCKDFPITGSHGCSGGQGPPETVFIIDVLLADAPQPQLACSLF